MKTRLFHSHGSEPFRDKTWKIRGEPLSARVVEYAHSIEEIDDLKQRFKRYDKKERYTLGDVLGQVLFHPRPTDTTTLKSSPPKPGETVVVSAVPKGPREIPSWSYGMPVIGKETTDGSVKAFPIFDRAYSPDDRFEPIGGREIALPDEAELVDGQVGLMVGGTKEDGEIENLFIPSGGGKLIAVNNDKTDSKLSSIVYDLDPTKKLSKLDRAPLHTVWRVMRPKFDIFSESVKASEAIPKPDPVVAWQLGKPPYSIIGHGAVTDSGSFRESGTGLPLLGFTGFRMGGMLYIGDETAKEKHLFGDTEDAESEMSCHLSTESLFKRPGGFGYDFDAPLKFEDLYQKDDPLPYPKRAHIRYDPCEDHDWIGEKREGFWRVQIESEIGGSHDKGTPPPGDRTPIAGGGAPPAGGPGTRPPPLLEIRPPPPPPTLRDRAAILSKTCYDLLEERRLGMAGTLPTFGKFFKGDSTAASAESYRYTPFRFAMPEILGKPMPTILGAADLRDYTLSTLTGMDDLLFQYNREMPITSRLLFFGGVQGDQFQPVYTENRSTATGRYLSGTGPGGLSLMPPEIDSADLRLQNQNGGHIPEILAGNVSECAFSLLPGVRLLFGYPDITLGSRKQGWHVRFDPSTGGLLWGLKVAAGTDTNLLSFPATATATDPFLFVSDVQSDNNLKWKSGTSFLGIHDHANTADRTYTYQNASGTLAFLSDIPAPVTQVWTRSGTDLHPTTAGDTVSITHSSTVPTLRGLTDTDTGLSVDGSNNFLVWAGGLKGLTVDGSQDVTAENHLVIKNLTAFRGVLAHAITASRTWTHPNASGTLALLDGVPGGQILNGGTAGIETLTLRANFAVAPKVLIGATGSLIADDLLALKAGTAFTGSITSPLTASRVWTVPNVNGTVAMATGVPGGQTINGGTGGGETLTLKPTLAAAPLVLINSTGGVEADRNLAMKAGGAFLGTFTHAISAARTWTAPNETGTLKLKKNHFTWLVPTADGLVNFTPVAVIAPAGIKYVSGFLPLDNSLFISVKVAIIASATDATVSVTYATQYGANGEPQNNHTGSTTISSSLLIGHITYVDITVAVLSILGGDHLSVKVTNNDAATTINLLGCLIEYLPTN